MKKQDSTGPSRSSTGGRVAVGRCGQVVGRRDRHPEQSRAIPPNWVGQERERVRRALIHGGPRTTQALAEHLGLPHGTVEAHLEALETAGIVRRDRAKRWVFRTESRRLPIVQGHMIAGEGTRHDCARYDDCLDAFIAATVAAAAGRMLGDVEGRCGTSCPCRGSRPDCDCHGTGCRWHEHVPARSAVAYQTATGYDATIYCGDVE